MDTFSEPSKPKLNKNSSFFNGEERKDSIPENEKTEVFSHCLALIHDVESESMFHGTSKSWAALIINLARSFKQSPYACGRIKGGMGFDKFLKDNSGDFRDATKTEEHKHQCYKSSIALLDGFHTLLKCRENEKKLKEKKKKVKENFLQECLETQLNDIKYSVSTAGTNNEEEEGEPAAHRMNNITTNCHTKISKEMYFWHRNTDIKFDNVHMEQWHNSPKNQVYYDFNEKGEMIQLKE